MTTEQFELRQDCLALLTCAPLTPCPKEESCCRVAKALLAQLPIPEPDPDTLPPMDEDEVMHYAVDWSAT
jgi:hypothetical protein